MTLPPVMPLHLLHPQSTISEEELRRRMIAARHYVQLTRAFVDVGFPDKKRMGTDLELLIVMLAVFIGDAEGRPMSATSVAEFIEVPRATVHRRLEALIALKKILKVGRRYHYAPDSIRPDPQNLIRKARQPALSRIVHFGRKLTCKIIDTLSTYSRRS